MIDPWTLAVAGIIVLTVIGLAVVVIDLFDAHVDLVRVRTWYPIPSLEHTQAKSVFWGQIARSATLFLIGGLAAWELSALDIPREGIAAVLYLITIVKVIDSFRARRARKEMIRLLNRIPDDRSEDQ